MTFLKQKKNSSAASDFFMLYWDQCTKPIKWFSSSLMVPSLPFLMLQSYPNFWFYSYITPCPILHLWNAVTSLCENKVSLYKSPSPYFLVLTSSVKTKEVEVIKFHRIMSMKQQSFKYLCYWSKANMNFLILSVRDRPQTLRRILMSKLGWFPCSKG